nr:AAA family ATPase [uncultured Schaedlerella sp.]
MKILATADWHIGNFRSPAKDGVNLRTEDTKRCLDELVRVAREEQPDYSLVSGDIFHVGRLWSDRCCEEIIMAIHYIRELAAVSEQVIVMRGTPNHDGTGQFNVLTEMFANCPNVQIVTDPQVLSFDDADIAVLPGFDKGTYRAQFPGLSREEENEVFTQELANIVLGLKAQCRPDKKSILMAHYTVPGCNMESGQTMLLTQFEPIISQETLLAADYDLVALGHIHRPQKVPNLYECYYSGAINALNFNDEGQERGFWIHTDMPFGGRGWDSRFYKTPIREFITFCFTDTDIAAFNLGQIDTVAFNYWRYNGAVKEKIVRIHYSCSEKNSKALNKALLEKTLLDDGAFMVWEILPDKIDEFVNRAELADTTDPESNLVKYLEEKQTSQEKVQELVLKARPIIAEAEASMPASVNTGIFEPVEISVRNYRNYEDETFHFDDITFCTINGQNGAGKSSLFMDAIIDCLYEQPREGMIKDGTGRSPWLRNDEEARSGSIMFTFRIGEKKYRVTRTRARSGKGTLNISCFIDGRWEDCSKERYNDTQQEILNIIGMDSFTFKSCALIMQDQYGLFLQAKPEERVEVLGTLLGLEIYQYMEKTAQDKARVNGAKNRELKQEVEIHNNTVSDFGNPEEALKICKGELKEYEKNLQVKTAERDEHKLHLAECQAAAERRTSLLAEIAVLQSKRADAEQKKILQQEIFDTSSAFLEQRAEIEKKVSEYNFYVDKDRRLAGESALYSSKKIEAEGFRKQAETEQVSIDGMNAQVLQREAELAALQPTAQDAIIQKNAAEYEKQKKLLDEAYEKERSYRALEQKLVQKKSILQQISSRYEADVNGMQLREEGYKKKAELLQNVECVDISHAKCGFLADAISAKQCLEGYSECYEERRKVYEHEAAPVNAEIVEIEKQLADVDFDQEEIGRLSQQITKLKPYVAQLEILNQRESRIALIKANLENLQLNILGAEKRLSTVKLKGSAAELECAGYAKSFEEHAVVQKNIQMLKPWLEKEKRLPVEQEKKDTARCRVTELEAEILELDMEITGKQAAADNELLAVNKIAVMTGLATRINAEVEAANELVKKKQMEIGGLQQKADQIAKLKKEIAALQAKQLEYAKETADYDILKNAFSQNGIPHQIIRSIIPQLTATSNTILGQMTGGKMGVEFRLEKTERNGKEKAALDIFIEEYGKTVLPYLSKSGGEKVKSSLSVILALAEIKSSAAGIQLGFLMIDEPPFLDSDGAQAYVDALEAIQRRYPDLKVMAITHDQEFKARFPQSVTIFKDEYGSHVRWD